MCQYVTVIDVRQGHMQRLMQNGEVCYPKMFGVPCQIFDYVKGCVTFNSYIIITFDISKTLI